MAEAKEGLNRSMGVWAGISVVIGTVIGSGIFFKQAQVLETAGGSTAAVLAWVVGGLITLAGGLTISEIGSRIPYTGGIYIYIERIYGKFFGFLAGWAQVFFYAPAIVGSLAAYFGVLFVNFFGLPLGATKWVALAAITLISLMNMLDNRVPSAFSMVTTFIKLLPIVAILIYGLFYGRVDALGQTVNAVSQHGGNFGTAVLATLFAYDGWATLTNMGGEIKNPGKNMPRAIVGGILIVLLAYAGIAFGMMKAMPANEIVKLGDNATYAVVIKAFGDFGGRALSLAILISIAGTLNGKMLAMPRMMYAMAEHRFLPRILMKVNRFKEPVVSILVLALLAGVLLFTISADWLSNLCIFVIWIFYTATFIGLFILRYREKRAGFQQQPAEFVVPLYPIIPLVAILGALFIIISTMITNPWSSLGSICLVLIGIPVYMLIQKRQR
ncbi:APC family permease [Weissella halotolerans]|uniref:Amino acid transporter n=1 Tax=Weissella halotolerans DSM 20190 TaxID=1123500 RepID=A0A0R2FYH2_9LACO|nr:amino acid permease [Weissella halotolerans]KRN33224.1 amino acid transporter [Weissella halotolerans DSM 20190]